MFTNAIVRPPPPNFAEGLTTADLGPPDYWVAWAEHAGYCAALEKCGVKVTKLDADPNFPDSTFIEDIAVVTERGAVLALPGAASRAGEVETVRDVLATFFQTVHAIEPPGTLEGGDVCQAGNHFFIGISKRTNEAGAEQLAQILSSFGYTSTFVDMRHERTTRWDGAPLDVLHLKSAIAYLGDNRLVLTEAMAKRAEFSDYQLIVVDEDEAYGANCLRVNDYVLLAAGHPKLSNKLKSIGYNLNVLDMSEFQRMDGGLSCLSLRF